jgi:WD40 repeat protein
MDMKYGPWKRSHVLFAVSLIVLLMIAPTRSIADVATKSSVIDLEGAAGALDFSPDDKYLAIDHSGWGGTEIFDLQRKRMAAHLTVGGIGTWNTDMMHYSPDGHQLAICGSGNDGQFISIYVYDTSTWVMVHRISDGTVNEIDTGDSCDGLAFAPDGKGIVRLTNQMLDKAQYNVVFYNTSTWAVTSAIRTTPFGSNGKDMVRHPPIGIVLSDPKDPTFNFVGDGGALAFSKNGRYLALSGRSFSAKPFRPGEGMIAFTPELITIDLSTRTLSHVMPGIVESLDWSPDGSRIAAGLDDDIFTINIFDAKSGAVLASEVNGPAHVLVRYTPDGKYLIEMVGKQVEIWDGTHEQLLQTIHAQPRCIAVSHDSHYFALGGVPNSILDVTAMLNLFTHPNGPKGKVIIYKLK